MTWAEPPGHPRHSLLFVRIPSAPQSDRVPRGPITSAALQPLCVVREGPRWGEMFDAFARILVFTLKSYQGLKFPQIPELLRGPGEGSPLKLTWRNLSPEASLGVFVLVGLLFWVAVCCRNVTPNSCAILSDSV